MSNPVIPPLRVNVLTEEEIADLLRHTEAVIRSGRFVLGPYTAAFERRFAELVDQHEVVTVNTGTTALEVIFRALGVAGRRVLVPTNTNFATAMAVINAGGQPVLYDGGLHFDLDSIHQQLNRADIAAVVVVHIGGHISPELPLLLELLQERGIPLVEDAAHAHGSTLDGQPAGTFGVAAAFSFFTTKVITTYEGGAVVTNNPEIAAAVRTYRDQGKDASGELHIVPGNSWRVTEVGAALGSILLDRFGDDIAARTAVINTYREALSTVPGIDVPTLPDGARLSGHKAIALLGQPERRASLKAVAAQQGVTIGRGVYDMPLHRQPIFQALSEDAAFPLADDFAARHICLPLWATITTEEVQRVVAAVAEALA